MLKIDDDDDIDGYGGAGARKVAIVTADPKSTFQLSTTMTMMERMDKIMMKLRITLVMIQ